jgi:glucose/arabinose dehydrogenase
MTRRIPLILASLLTSTLCLAQIPADITLEPAFGGATFDRPVAVRHAGDGSGRKFVVQLDGLIRIVDASDNVLATPFLDMSSLTSAGGERGLLGLAFHPDYANNGRIFVNYTDAEPGNGIDTGHTVIAEFQASVDDPDVIDFDSRNTVIVIPQDFANHNGGDIHFGPDGYLYIGMGDGGSSNDPCLRGQGLDSSAAPPLGRGCETAPAGWLLGKMLRIDIDNSTPASDNNLCAANGDGSAPYAIPSDNPFVGQLDRCGEVWAYGLRNPYRFSFDRATGDLWVGDVGQGWWEEISLLAFNSPAGGNFGWKTCEGSYLRGSASACTLAGSILPVVEYPNYGNQSAPGEGCSVTGGFRYRGPVESLFGTYVFADYCEADIFFANEVAGVWDREFFQGVAGNVLGFGEDEQGNLYISVGSAFSTGQFFVFSGDVAPGDPLFDDRFEGPTD